MEEVELLVHISAALRRQDDQRFLDIAQSIIDFEPVTLIRNGNANDSEQEATGDASPGHQLLPSSSLSDDDGSHSPTPGADSALKSIRRPSLTGSTTSNPGKAQRRPSTENLNPPYRNPYHGVRPLEKPQLLFETPSQSHRPRTAPERPNTVQVPRTGPNFRRTQSESSSFGSLASHISNSQPSNKSDVREEEDSTAPPSSNWLRGGAQEDHRGVTRSLSQTSLDSRQTPYKRRKLLGQDTEVKVIPRPPISRAFLLLDRSLDWTSSLESSQTQSSSVPSTATVSQSLQENASMEEQDKATPPVILISSESSKQGDGRLTQQGGLASSSSHTRMLEVVPISGGSPDTSQQIIKMPLFERLGLKPNVSAPQPNVSEERFVTHITTHLQDLASQLPFERFFRPVEVTRDVKVLERGYWLLDVQIVSDEAAEAARSVEKIKVPVQTMQERFQGATSSERLRKYEEAKRNGSLYQTGKISETQAQGLWTEDELVRFWKSFSVFIENGKAGWGTRLVGEDVSDDSDAVQVRIRIFAWGEVLGHLYLAIWVLSDKLAGRIPTDWIASDGSHVIKMAGTRSGRGSLPLWSRKGPEGDKGCWGLAEET